MGNMPVANSSLGQQLRIMPVGWGFSSLHMINYGKPIATVITDGGAHLGCYSEIVNKQSHLVSELRDALIYSDLVVWIPSHFDYDHVSLTAKLLETANKDADVCIMSFTYSEKACREALAMYIAEMMYELRLPSLPELLKIISRRCRRKVYARRGFKLRIDDSTYYEFLWPSPSYIRNPSICREIQEELWKRIEESCKRNLEICRHKEELINSIQDIQGKLIKSSESLQVDELDVRDILFQSEKVKEKPHERSMDPSFVEILSPKEVMNIENRFLRTLKFYNLIEIKERLENVYSLAYILRSLKPQTHTLRITTESGDDLRLVHWLLRGYHVFLSENNVLMYLGDIDNSSIKEALEGYTPIDVSILIPAHHGNRWHSRIESVHARLTYLNRCYKHTHDSLKGRLRKGYLNNSELIVLGGHKYDIVYYF